MPLSAEEKKAFNKEAYGSENYPEAVVDYLADNSHLSVKMLAMSVLSDAQERLAHIDPGDGHAKVIAAMNQVRQDMNKSKYMIDTYLLDKRKPFSSDDVEQAVKQVDIKAARKRHQDGRLAEAAQAIAADEQKSLEATKKVIEAVSRDKNPRMVELALRLKDDLDEAAMIRLGNILRSH